MDMRAPDSDRMSKTMVMQQSGISSSAVPGCAWAAKVQSKPDVHVCCQPCATGDAVSNQPGAGQSGSVGADHQAGGFQPPKVQPMLETWIESVKRDMLQKQELMFQVLRMEMLQARPPLWRGAYGLLPSF